MVCSGIWLDALTCGDRVAPVSRQSTLGEGVAIDGGDVGSVDPGCSSLDLLLPQPARANARTMSAADRFTTSSLLSLEAALHLPPGAGGGPGPPPAGPVPPPALGRSATAPLPPAAVPSDELGPRAARGDGDANPSR